MKLPTHLLARASWWWLDQSETIRPVSRCSAHSNYVIPRPVVHSLSVVHLTAPGGP